MSTPMPLAPGIANPGRFGAFKQNYIDPAVYGIRNRGNRDVNWLNQQMGRMGNYVPPASFVMPAAGSMLGGAALGPMGSVAGAGLGAMMYGKGNPYSDAFEAMLIDASMQGAHRGGRYAFDRMQNRLPPWLGGPPALPPRAPLQQARPGMPPIPGIVPPPPGPGAAPMQGFIPQGAPAAGQQGNFPMANIARLFANPNFYENVQRPNAPGVAILRPTQQPGIDEIMDPWTMANWWGQ